MANFYISSRIVTDPAEKAFNPLQWYQDLGSALQKKGLVLDLGNSVKVSSATDAAALFNKLQSDPAGLSATLNVPQANLASYLDKALHVGDNLLATVATAGNETVDVSPGSPLARDLDLTSNAAYATTGKPVEQPQDSFTEGNATFQLDPLNGQNFMDAQTFEGTSWAWPRDNQEIEVIRNLGGAKSGALLNALDAKDSQGRTIFSRVRKPDSLEPFTLGYGGDWGQPGMSLDEMRWDPDAHRARMQSPYVKLTLEEGRYDRQPINPSQPDVLGARQATLGTDDFFDRYLDTSNGDLESEKLEYRTRDRRDDPGNVTNRRLLVAAKDGTTIDRDLGDVKLDHKIDVRSDGASPDTVNRLLSDAEQGTADWAGGAMPPAHFIYDRLTQDGKLEAVGPHKDVLRLGTLLYVDSLRSRVHFNESSAAALRTFMQQTTGKLASVVDLAQKALPQLSGADAQGVQELLDAAAALQDASAVAALARPGLQALEPSTNWDVAAVKALMQDPTQPQSQRYDFPTLAKRKVVADATAKAYQNFSDQLDAVRSLIANPSKDSRLAPYADLFRTYWQQKDPNTFAAAQTMDPFLAQYDALQAKAAPDKQAALSDFNAWLSKQSGSPAPLTEADFDALRPQLVNAAAKIWSREIAEGGQIADALYFDEARLAFADAQRSMGNFIIDTLDFSNYVTPEAWDKLPDTVRNDPNQPLPKDAVFDTTLMNEMQIELGNEVPYTDRIKQCEQQIANDRASMVMRYLDQVGAPGDDPNNPSSYGTAARTYFADASKVDGFNTFLAGQGSALRPVTQADLQGLDSTLFNASNRALPVRTSTDPEKELEGTQWILKQLMDAQAEIADARFDRVKSELGKAGLDNKKLTWNEPTGSKLEIGLQSAREQNLLPTR